MNKNEKIALLIDELEDIRCNNFDANTVEDKTLKEAVHIIQTTRWIPVSERPPEDSGKYFVTIIDKDDEMHKQTGVAWYLHPKDCDVEEGEWRELMIDKKVTAWMPLPAPYEPQKREG